MTVERVRVGDVLTPSRNDVVPDPSNEYVKIGVRSFGKGVFHYESTIGSGLGSLRFFDVLPDRLVVSNIKGWEGAVAVTTEDDRGCIASNRFLQYVARDGRIDVRWARWYFLSDAGLELIQRASTGSADRSRTLAVQRFEALEIPLPPIEDQRRVAARLDRAAIGTARLRTLRTRSSMLSGALPTACFAESMQGVVTSATRLGDVLDLVREPIEIEPLATYVPIGLRSFGRGVFHYERQSGHQLGKLRFQKVSAQRLAISNIKAWEGAIATTGAADIGTTASNRFLFFRPSAGTDAVDFFWALLLSSEGLAALGRASPGSADRNRTLAVGRFENIVLNLPSLEDQALIGRRVRLMRERVGAFGCDPSPRTGDRIDALLPAAVNEAFAGLS